MAVSPLAFVVAAAAGALTAWVSLRGLRGTPRTPNRGAAIVRATAVALAVFAAFGPTTQTSSRVRGETLVAPAPGADAIRSDFQVSWPDPAPDAAAALETLRAARDADAPANLAIATGGDIGRGRAIGGAVRALRRTGDVEPFVVALAPAPSDETRGPAPRIVVPSNATEGLPVTLTLDGDGVAFAGGEVRVSVEGHETRFPVDRGAMRAVSPPLDLPAGTHVVVAEMPGRRPAAAIADVAGAPRVLVVSADGAPRDAIGMLRAQGLDVADVPAAGLRADDVAGAAVIVLGAGVTCGDLAPAVAARVRGGAGFLVLGGEGVTGLSRMRNTPLDALLPVVPPPPPAPAPEPPAPPPPVKKPDPAKPKPSLDEGDKRALRVALLLIIDTSGSMGGTKLQMAKQSAIAAASALSPQDRVAVYEFADDANEVAPFQDAVDLRTLFRRIGALVAGGGTNFYPALRLGYRAILGEACGIRHVILLTDGETLPATWQEMVENGATQGVTLSTIAVGDGADTNLLARLATWGHGKLYLANDPARLPEVVTLDTMRFTNEPRERAKQEKPKIDAEDLPAPPSDAAARDAHPDEPPAEPHRDEPAPRRPHVVSSASFLAGLDATEWPALPFAEDAPARPASQVVLAFESGPPALTLGRAGLGRVAVVAAGAGSREAREFRRWPQSAQFLAQLVRSLAEPAARGTEPADVQFVEADDGRAFAIVAGADAGVLLLDPLTGGAPLDLRCAARSGFALAELGVMPPAGVYAGTFTSATPRRCVAVSPGRRGPAPDAALRIAEAAGATIADRVPAPRDGTPRRGEEPCGAPFLAAAAALLVADAAFRRAARRVA